MSREGKSAREIAGPRIGKRRVEIRKVIVGLERRRIHFPMDAGGKREFGSHAPRVANKKTVALAVSVAVICGIKGHLRRIHLLQQKACDWTAADDPRETSFAAHKTERP